MTIKRISVTVGEITNGYINNDEQGVRGYGGLLDIRPPYQREFIYNDKEQQAVITTVLAGYPLNVMYWVKRSEDAECPYEVMDGQQRTLSICEYVTNQFFYEFKKFINQPEDIKHKILNYPLTVYICEGEPSEKLEWFKTINIAGIPLNDQELLNAIYSGPFVTKAKEEFSNSQNANVQKWSNFISGSVNRQDYLRTALLWVSRGNIDAYMSQHRADTSIDELKRYFNSVLDWVTGVFTGTEPQMKGLPCDRMCPTSSLHSAYCMPWWDRKE